MASSYLLLLQNGSGVYRPPRFAPTSMDDDDKISRKEKQAMRKDRDVLMRAKQSTLAKELMDEIEGRPEEVDSATHSFFFFPTKFQSAHSLCGCCCACLSLLCFLMMRS